MPRLGSFLICEKLIIDQQQKPTLISLFQGITAVVPEGQAMPKDTLAANMWTIFCEWYFAQDELNKSYDQVVEVLFPDGSPSPVRGRVTFKEIAKDGTGTRTYFNLFGMPLAMPGFLSVNVWVELDNERITDVATYRIKVDHTSTPPTPNEGGTFAAALSRAKPS